MSIDSATKELIEDCLSRVRSGEDVCAPFDLSGVYMSHVGEKDVDLSLAIIEALAILAKRQGCIQSAEFLEKKWPQLRMIIRKRWERESSEPSSN